MVAENLLELPNPLGRDPLEPIGEALVQVGALRLRHPLVGRVPNQLMAEAERLVAWEDRFRRHDEVLQLERMKAVGHSRPARLG